MTSQVTVRRISAPDWRTWRDLRQRALRQAPEAFGATLAQWTGPNDVEQRWRDRLSDVEANYVADLVGEPVGMVSGACTEHEGEVALISMFVDEHARGHGVGDALVQAVVQWARQRAASHVVLDVHDHNTAAQTLYARHGFQPQPPDGSGTTVMVLPLTGPPPPSPSR